MLHRESGISIGATEKVLGVGSCCRRQIMNFVNITITGAKASDCSVIVEIPWMHLYTTPPSWRPHGSCHRNESSNGFEWRGTDHVMYTRVMLTTPTL
jgi:hypothetical protein